LTDRYRPPEPRWKPVAWSIACASIAAMYRVLTSPGCPVMAVAMPR
jgi:hypothetical protein